MKKEDVNGLFAYLVIIAIAIVFGLTVLRNYSSSSQMGGMFILFVLGAVIAGILLNGFMFEMAHVLGAKLGHYDILSVSVFGITYTKEKDGSKFKFKSFEGLTGETKIYPNCKEKESNPNFFLLGGTVWFAIELIVCMVLFYTFKSFNNVAWSNTAYFILTMMVVGAMIYLYSILPFKLDTINDGYRLRMVSNPKNKAAFNELLRVEHAIAEGQSDVEIKTFTEITNFTADLNLNKVYLLLDKKEYDEAEKLLDIILSGGDGVSHKVYLRARAQKIYINIMNKPLEEAKTFYEKEVPQSERREISEDISMASIRAYLLMSGLLDKSRSECILALNNIYKAYKRTSVNRRKIEMNLFNEALEKVNEVHPDWELMDYKLSVEEKKKGSN